MITVIENYEFITYKEASAEFVFSTAKGDLNFNIERQNGINNLNMIKEWFKVESVGYLKQIHSDKIYEYSDKICVGDALITNKKNVAIGVFTADCVPILLYDTKKHIVAAIHSGWKGTLSQIVLKTIEEMQKQYGVEPKDIIAYIGPHNRICCYEVGADLINNFKTEKLYTDFNISKGKNLDLLSCIKIQLKCKGVLDSNIHDLSLCTYCDKEYKFHSYRKTGGDSGRLFSFIILR